MSDLYSTKRKALPKLVRFDCGCIGFEPNPGETTALLVYWCDSVGEDSPYGLGFRSPRRFTERTPVSAPRAAEIFSELCSLVGEGEHARKFRGHLKDFLADSEPDHGS